jgi:hypothetical protein
MAILWWMVNGPDKRLLYMAKGADTRIVSDRTRFSGGHVPDRLIRSEIVLWEASGYLQLDIGQWSEPESC